MVAEYTRREKKGRVKEAWFSSGGGGSARFLVDATVAVPSVKSYPTVPAAAGSWSSVAAGTARLVVDRKL